jgi:hypothetical protein
LATRTFLRQTPGIQQATSSNSVSATTLAEEIDAGLSAAETSRFTFDFSRVPVHGSARGAQTEPELTSPSQVNAWSPLEPSSATIVAPIQAKGRNNQDDAYEQESEAVADRVVAGAGAGLITPLSSQPLGQMVIAPDRKRAVESALEGGGQPIAAPMRAGLERSFGYDFSHVRIHAEGTAAGAAAALRAQAFTVGSHVVFGAGRFAPETAEGRHLLAHELTHVVQQQSFAGPSVQRHSAADARLPATLPEALAFAAAAQVAINAANARLAASPELRRRNAHDLAVQEGFSLTHLTPRHDSAAGAPTIEFFASLFNYAGSVSLPATITHHVSGLAIGVRARDHVNVDTMLPAAEIENRLFTGLTEAAVLRAAGPGAPPSFELYRAQFDALFDQAPFAGMSNDLAPGLDSRGPRTPHARNIFLRILAEDATFRAAYEANAARFKERVDNYVGPDSFNPLNSPRLQRLRTAFTSQPMPVVGPFQYAVLKAAVQAASVGLDPDDRQVVARSNEWQTAINQQVTDVALRQEINTIIATAPPAPPVPAPPPPPAPAPPPPPPGGALTPQQFVDRITLAAPVAPLVGNHRTEPAVLTPTGPAANPGVVLDTRIRLLPVAGVSGPAVSPQTRWAVGSVTGAPFTANIRSEAVAVDATLDLLNTPVVRATPAPVRRIAITDNRRANFIANWRASIVFDDSGNPTFFVPGAVVRYQHGTHIFRVGAVLTAPLTNPGLDLFVSTRVLRGALAIFASPAAPFPADQDHTAPVAPALVEPVGLAAVGDPLDFELKLLASDRTTVLSTKIVHIAVLPSAVYGKAAAEASAHADRLWLNNPAPGGFLNIMTAAGGTPARLAAAVTAGTIILQPLTIRHDSDAAVVAVRGGPDPNFTGYFAGDTYAPAPNTGAFVAAAGAAAWSRLGGVLATATPHMVAVNRTKDVSILSRRLDPELIMLTVHESTHALDLQVAPATPLEQQFKTEFRAYWNDGRFNAEPTAFDPTLTAPGPRARRARKIFEQMYGSPTYPFMKPAYDSDPAFRIMVDNYLFPDGINLILSPRLDRLQALISAGVVGGFPAFRNNVQAFVGLGPNPPPPGGVLDADDRAAVRSSRTWRDLIDALAATAPQRASIKVDLGIL